MGGSKPKMLPEYAGALRIALGERDADTLAHCDRVVSLSLSLGATCGLSSAELATLKLASCFHDVGKIGIPDVILRKPGRLNDEEWQTMQNHSVIGERILSGWSQPPIEEAAAAVRHHHERFDGNGYPDRLAGDEIPLLSRIISIVDAYDAMALPRAYHPPRSHEQVMALLRGEADEKYDPTLFARFEEIIDHSAYRA